MHLRSRTIGNRPGRAALAACLACGLLLSLTSSAGADTFTNPDPITIPAAGNATPYPSPITVSGLTGSSVDVNVRLNGFSHVFPSDVAMVLVPPTGTNILLMSGAGGSTPTSNVNITFDDAAAASLPAAGGIATGSYKPTARSLSAAVSFPAPGPVTAFCNPGPVAGGTSCTQPAGGNALDAAVGGFNPNGTWNLYVKDIGAPDAGSISGGWSLDITAGGTKETLLVAKNGTGSGTVTGTGINCGIDCAGAYDNPTSVTLTAAPVSTSDFAGFTGCDSTPTATTCVVNVNAAKNVTATFNNKPPQPLTVAKNGTGTGTVTSAPAGINCGATCSFGFVGNTSVVLTATAPVGNVIAGFTGCDSSTATTCTVVVSAAKNVTVTFTQVPFYTLTVSKGGAGAGTVTATGITCGADCSEPYNEGTSVVLNATPQNGGGRFESWTGCDNPVGNVCTMSLTAEKSVTANFKQGPDPTPTPDTMLTPTPAPSPTPTVVRDTTPPVVTLSGVPSSMSVKAFLKGVRARVTRNESSSIDARLEGSAKKATLAASFNLSLASRAVSRGTGAARITLKPSKKLVGSAKKISARVRVVVTDVAGNRRTVTKSIKVKR